MVLVKQMLIVVCGCQFTGKTTLGDRLREELGIPFIPVDRVRTLLYGKTEFDLEKDMHQLSRAYPAMRGAAGEILGKGDSVIIEGTFSRQAYQEDIIVRLRSAYDVSVKILLLVIPEDKEREEVLQRVALRPPDYPSAARTIDDYLRVKARFEPIVLPHLVIDTTEALEESVKKALAYITAP